MAGIAILRRLLMKKAMKESAPFQHEGIMSISKTLSSNVDAKVKRWVESAKRQGQDLDKMSEQELKYLIELNKPKAPTVLSNEEAYKFLNQFLNQNKKGKVIKADFGKPFAEEVVTVESVIADIKKLDPIESMKETNKVLRGEGRYKSLSKADREKIAGDESVTDHIFERNIKYDADGEEIIDWDAVNDIDTEDFAHGGRTGTGLNYLLGEDDQNSRVPYGKGKMVEGETYITPKNFYSLGIGPGLNDFMREREDVPRDEGGIHTTLNKKDLEYLWEALQGKHPIEDIEDKLMFRFSRINPEKESKFHIGIGKGQKEIGFKKNIDFNKLLMGKAEGGRIGFGLGGFNAARRAFLKIMGGTAAGVGVAKSGLLSILKGGKPVVKELTQVPIKNISGMPAWFKPLVNRVIKEGEEVSGDLERVITHKTTLPGSKTDVYVTQDLNTGDVVADIGMGKHGWGDGHLGQPVRLEYKASEVIEPPIIKEGKVAGYGKGTKTKEEFWVEEAEFTGGHPENVKFEESTFNKFGEHGSDFTEVEKFATGKVKSTKPTKKKLQTEFEQGKAEADAERWTEEAMDDVDMASGGRVPMIFGGSAGLRALIARLRGKSKKLFPKIGEGPREVGKLVDPKIMESIESLNLQQLENLLEALKIDKRSIAQIAENKAMKDPGLDFLMGKMKEDKSFGFDFDHLAKYRDIDNDIMVVEQMIKNKKMKGRKLNATGGRVPSSGGLAGMLGE